MGRVRALGFDDGGGSRLMHFLVTFGRGQEGEYAEVSWPATASVTAVDRSDLAYPTAISWLSSRSGR